MTDHESNKDEPYEVIIPSSFKMSSYLRSLGAWFPIDGTRTCMMLELDSSINNRLLEFDCAPVEIKMVCSNWTKWKNSSNGEGLFLHLTFNNVSEAVLFRIMALDVFN